MIIEKYITWKTVLLHEADMFARASAPSILNFLIEAAREHAQIMGFGSEHLNNDRLFWVLSRIKIEIERYPRWREKIRIETWPRKTDGVYAYRDFIIMNENDEVYARATGCWLVVDIETRKIKRLHDFFNGLEFLSEKALDMDALKIKFQSEKTSGISVPVLYSDIDFNGHINSSKYLQKIIDSINIDIMTLKKIKGIELNYNKEGSLNDSINIYSHPVQENEYEYTMVSEINGNDLCTAKLYFH